MAEWDYGDERPYDDWSWDRGDTNYENSPAWRDFLSWNNPTGPGSSGDPNADNGGGGAPSWLQSVLSTLGPTLGPLLRAGTSLAGGQMGANAANDAARLQANALNRGMDLQTAQWLQQQANQAPWLAAGREALPQLQQMAWQGQRQHFQPGQTISGSDYGLPSATPGWSPQTYQGPAGINAQDYRYTPGQTPDAAQYASGPPQLYQGAMPGTHVANLTGQQVLDQDPGYQFRQEQARKALEASALARGAGMSGATLGALQSQSQDLASQEYGNAWQRMMARDVEQYGRDWGQYQQHWNQGVQGTQLGLQTNAQNFGQAMNAAQLREQLAQQAGQQGFAQALAGQGQQYQQGLQTQQWNQGQAQQYEQDLYNRMLQQSQLRYGQDVAQNEADYQRQLASYNSQTTQQTADWNRWAALAGYGPQAAQQLATSGQAGQTQLNALLARLGTAQGEGAAGSALQRQRGLTGAALQIEPILSSLNR